MTEAEKNRQQFPTIARILDQVREFFPEAKVTYAREGVNEKGKKEKYDGVETDRDSA